MSEMSIWRDTKNDVFRFSGTLSRHDIERVSLDPMDRLVLEDCSGDGRSAADWLLALELIFRRIGEQPQSPPEEQAPSVAAGEQGRSEPKASEHAPTEAMILEGRRVFTESDIFDPPEAVVTAIWTAMEKAR